MGAIWIHDIDDVLEPFVGRGIPGINYEPGYLTRSRGSGGLDRLDGVMWHHTVSPPGTDGQRDVDYICYNNPYAPSPVSQFYIARTGWIWVCACGAANHGGSGGAWEPGDPTPLVAVNRANTRLLGVEMANRGTGDEVWPWRQIEAAITLGAAIEIAERSTGNWNPNDDHHLAHKEYCGPGTTTPGRKQDPLGPWENHPDKLWPDNSSWGDRQGNIDLFRSLIEARVQSESGGNHDMIDLDAPLRIYDSRKGSGKPGAGDPGLQPGQHRDIAIPFGNDHAAVELNVTITNDGRGAGWLAVAAANVDPDDFQHSDLNWNPGEPTRNMQMRCKVGPLGTIRVLNGPHAINALIVDWKAYQRI